MPRSSCGRATSAPTAGNTASSWSRRKWNSGEWSSKPVSNIKSSPYAKPGAISGVRPAPTTRQPTAEERRRAQRVLLRMRVLVHIANKPEPVVGHTHTVSATGAMVIVPQGFDQGTKLTLENPKTPAKVEVN